MQQEKVKFDNGHGDELAGVIHQPDGNAAGWILFAHCFTCTKNIKAAVHVSQALVDAGFGVLRFDFTGLGESSGEFHESSFSSNVSDLVAAAKFLENEHEAPVVLVGHSLGGAAVLRAAHEIPSVRAVSTIAAPADPAHVKHVLGGAIETIHREGKAEVKLGSGTITVGETLLNDLERGDWQEVVRGLRRPLLIFHSPFDETVSIDNAQMIYEHALHPKSFVSLENADHLLSKAEDSRYVADVIAAWASRYIDDRGRKELAESDEVEGVVATIGRKKFRTEVRSRGHVLIADEPEQVGGADLGISPYDLLAASLATCTAMTLRIYADFKKIDLAEVAVRVRHDRVHEEDCEHCEEKNHHVDRLRRELSITGNLSGEQRQRLVEIADRCPVHKTLTNEIRIETELKSNGQDLPD